MKQKGIRTFKDETLERGEEISSALHKAIEESRSSIIVFSEDFASSRWCLDELVKIIECKNEKGQLVLPLFYYVEPSEVRHQSGSFAEALFEHRRRFKDDKEEQWRSALQVVANIHGWHLKNRNKHEYKFIERIVEEVAERIKLS